MKTYEENYKEINDKTPMAFEFDPFAFRSKE